MELDFKLYNTKEASVMLNVTQNTLQQMIRDGRINAIKLGNSEKPRYRITKQAIDDFLIGPDEQLESLEKGG